MEEVLSLFRKVLTYCREKKIKLVRHKLEFSTDSNFLTLTLEVRKATDQQLPR